MNFIGSNRIFAAMAQVSSWMEAAVTAKNKLLQPKPTVGQSTFSNTDSTDARNKPQTPEQRRAQFKVVTSGESSHQRPAAPHSSTLNIRERIEIELERQSQVIDYSDIMELLNNTCLLTDTLATAHPSSQAQKCQVILENLSQCVEMMHGKLVSIHSFRNMTDVQFTYQSVVYFEHILNTGLMETLDHALKIIHDCPLVFDHEKRAFLFTKVEELESQLDSLVTLTNDTNVAEKISVYDSNYLHSIRAKLSLGLVT